MPEKNKLLNFKLDWERIYDLQTPESQYVLSELLGHQDLERFFQDGLSVLKNRYSQLPLDTEAEDLKLHYTVMKQTELTLEGFISLIQMLIREKEIHNEKL